ncbi:MAG: hypothetical protein K6U03_06530 [Firmicutes bacterium]|nr:hypothetical protein [Bacillota bacterium]
MNDRFNQIGFSQRIRLEWLEATANLVLAENDEASIHRALKTMLQEKLSIGGEAKRGTREKAISILKKIWVHPPQDLQPLQIKGLRLLSTLPPEEFIAVHWGMTMAVYPFWGAVAAQVGRLLRLQGMAAAAQVQRRVREEFGERETVSRATRRVLRCFIDWGVLKETPEKGVYAQGIVRAIDYPPLIAWLTEAFLHAHPNGSVDLRMALDATNLFPFRLGPISAEHLVALSGRLDLLRHGLDEELIILRTDNIKSINN